jgi:hypothetical protein
MSRRRAASWSGSSCGMRPAGYLRGGSSRRTPGAGTRGRPAARPRQPRARSSPRSRPRTPAAPRLRAGAAARRASLVPSCAQRSDTGTKGRLAGTLRRLAWHHS